MQERLDDDQEDEFHKLDDNAMFANVLAAVMHQMADAEEEELPKCMFKPT